MATHFLQDTFGLTGQSLVVTGATGGLGSAMVVALVKAGVRDVHSIELPQDPAAAAFREKISSAGGRVVSYECDLENTQSIRQCFARMWDAGVQPDLQLNCAGVIKRNSCEGVTDEEINFTIDVNFKAVYVCMQEFGTKLLSSGKTGRIINIASVNCYRGGSQISIYSSTKGAVLQMTKAFSNEWCSKGILVNCIAPGYMSTSMTTEYRNNPTVNEYLISQVPLGRWGEPEDLQAAVLFLAAPGNTFTTGTCLVVDGGFCAT